MEVSNEMYQLLESKLNLLGRGLEVRDKLLEEKDTSIALLTEENDRLKRVLGHTFKAEQTGAAYSDENESLIAGFRVRNQ